MEESTARPTWEGKRSKKPVNQDYVDYIVNTELVDYILCNPVRKFMKAPVSVVYFPPPEGSSISELLNGSRKLEADVLRHYRTDKHTDFFTDGGARLVRA
jgi:hypothetical protein